MKGSIKLTETISRKEHLAVIVADIASAQVVLKDKVAFERFSKLANAGEKLVSVQNGAYNTYIILATDKKDASQVLEYYRTQGGDLLKCLNKEKIEAIELTSPCATSAEVLAFAEGMLLANYSFSKYKTAAKENSFKTIYLASKSISKADVKQLQHLLEAVYLTRDLVNEPVVFLTAEQFSTEMEKYGKAAGFEVEVLDKQKIRSLKMGGLLAINAGSPNPPTFNILTYKPKKHENKQPIILVGKGVVYDTGGLSLKETANSMDIMKCDMAGGAAVLGAMYAIAKNELPFYIVGLIPATENRPDGNAITPGDVITMHSGTTVEILNTDAEGRVILADALSFAKQYKPELVLDFATLTGAAIMAVGKYGSVMLGTASEETKSLLKSAGSQVYERLVELPLWEEYAKEIESDIADLKNLGNGTAGATTAAKFLEHFTDYPWIHVDIAGPAYIKGEDNYRGKNATGMGVRLIYQFVLDYMASKK